MMSFKPFTFSSDLVSSLRQAVPRACKSMSLRALLHRVAGRQNRDIVIAVDFVRREPSASKKS